MQGYDYYGIQDQPLPAGTVREEVRRDFDSRLPGETSEKPAPIAGGPYEEYSDPA